MFDVAHGLTLTGWCDGRALWLAVAGELDLASVADLTTAVEALVDPGMELTLDLDGLTFVDSTGLRALRRIAAAASASGTWSVLFLAAEDAPLRRTVALSGTHRDELPLVQL